MRVDVLRMRMKQRQLQYLTLKATDSDSVLFDPSDTSHLVPDLGQNRS
jgi:hypothetical protein